jgi:hypothetical protein
MIDTGILPSVRNPHRDAAALPETVAIHELHCHVEKQAKGVADAGTKSRSPRNVRFAVDQHGIIQTHIQTAELPLDYANDEMHWSSKEKEDFRRRAKKEATKYYSCRRIKRLEIAFSNGNCATSATPRQDMEHMLEWARGKGRGLEFHVSELFRDAQICVVLDSVLYYQQLMMNQDTTSNIEETFAMFCREKTSSAREFATRMAACDAMAAHSDSCQSRSVNTSKACRHSGVPLP